jgi:type I restriction enzyme M protein
VTGFLLPGRNDGLRVNSLPHNENCCHVADAWVALDKTVIGYEMSFNKVFYRHKPLRDLAEVTTEILTLEAETEGLLKKLVSFVGQNL